jgi:hypothetical protein
MDAFLLGFIFDARLIQKPLLSVPVVRSEGTSGIPSGFPFSSEFHFLFPPFLMIYPQSLSAFGRKKSGNNAPGKIQYVCLTANSRHSRSMGRCPVKQKSQQQPALMAQQYY